MLARRNFILLCIAICMLQVKCVDKYTDENRPYEFGFTIDGEQHRHEKKDENGIIMGEFGFITADGVYHVTVYATDENGGFKILSMKNIRVKPYPTAKTGSERGRSLEYSSSPQIPLNSSVLEQKNKQLKESQKPGVASPAKSCSHCSLPTTTTTTTEPPHIPNNNLNQISAISQEPLKLLNLNQYQENNSQKYISTQGQQHQGQQHQGQQHQGQQQQGLQQQGLQQQGQQQQGLQQQGLQQQGLQQQGLQQQGLQQQGLQQYGQQQQEQIQQGPINQGKFQQGQQQTSQYDHGQNYPQHEIATAQNYAQSGQNSKENYPQESYTQEGLGSPNYQIQQQQHQKQEQLQQHNQQQQQQQYSNQFDRGSSNSQSEVGSVQNYPQTGQNAKENYPQKSYTENGLSSPNYQTGSNQDQTYPESKERSDYPGSGKTYTQSVTSDSQGKNLQPESNRNPKSYEEQSQYGQIPRQGFNALSSPPNSFVPQENLASKKPQLISAQMQIVDKNTDIHYKRPGEKEGLPKGLTKDDMSQLLYTFNYTVGFHGHFEEGYKNGAKVGYYYVTGRNGVRTRVDYVADENGFRPKITQEVLDLLSDDVPKPDTEKDLKYGLKGYEFKWLYYPVDTK